VKEAGNPLKVKAETSIDNSSRQKFKDKAVDAPLDVSTSVRGISK
jgi:hypothetical protein